MLGVPAAWAYSRFQLKAKKDQLFFILSTRLLPALALTGALASFRQFNYEHVYLRPASQHQARNVIDMLRALVGDSAFFAGIRSYYLANRHSTALTDDLQRHLAAARISIYALPVDPRPEHGAGLEARDQRHRYQEVVQNDEP